MTQRTVLVARGAFVIWRGLRGRVDCVRCDEAGNAGGPTPARTQPGLVSASSCVIQAIACSRLAPHIDALGRSERHTAGRSGLPKIRQRSSSASCTQRVPAGLPSGMPGIGLEIDGAMQQAPQRARQALVGCSDERPSGQARDAATMAFSSSASSDGTDPQSP